MSSRIRQLGVTVACALALAGCASSAASENNPAAGSGVGSMTPGMIMPDGSTMGAAAPSTATRSPGPSKAAKMICTDETRQDIKKVLVLPSAPVGRATWRDHLYTCTYQLPMGRLVLSVKELPHTAATTAFFTTTRQRLGKTFRLDGLGEGAFGSADGKVVLRKDNNTLQVDASGLPVVFGTQGQKRTDFAYEIASDILGCWTGDE